MSQHINKNRKPWNADYYSRLASIFANYAKCNLPDVSKTGIEPLCLDVGCGFGETMLAMKTIGIKSYGLDIDPKCLEASGSYGRTFLTDAKDIRSSFKPNTFDLSVCSHVLEHVKDPIEVLNQISAVTKGPTIIAVPNLARLTNFFLRRPRYINEGHLHGWDHHHLLTMIKYHTDFKAVEWLNDLVVFPIIRNRWLYSKILSETLEGKILPTLFPMQVNSLILVLNKSDPNKE